MKPPEILLGMQKNNWIANLPTSDQGVDELFKDSNFILANTLKRLLSVFFSQMITN